jgi:hypothetical protein
MKTDVFVDGPDSCATLPFHGASIYQLQQPSKEFARCYYNLVVSHWGWTPEKR